MSTPTPSIPGVDRDALADAIHRALIRGGHDAYDCRAVADAALAYIAAQQWPRACNTCGAKYGECPECAADDAYEKGRKDAACELEHVDEWVEVDKSTWFALPKGARIRQDWVRGVEGGGRLLVHRDDLPADAALVERMARALHAAAGAPFGWDEDAKVRDKYRTLARVAMTVAREEGR